MLSVSQIHLRLSISFAEKKIFLLIFDFQKIPKIFYLTWPFMENIPNVFSINTDRVFHAKLCSSYFFFFEEKYKYNLELCCWKQGIEWRSSGKWKRKGSRKKEMEENSWEKKGKRKIRAIRKKKNLKKKVGFWSTKKSHLLLNYCNDFFPLPTGQ